MCTGMTHYNRPDAWINADYEQPNTARRVLVFAKDAGILVGFFVDGWGVYGVDDDFEPEVTHWRELPEPPKMEDEE